jgi:hypothetical protein
LPAVLIFPRGPLDRPASLVARTGSFWSDIFGDIDFLQALASADAVLQEQTEITARETLNSLSRKTAPLFRQRLWQKLTLRSSQRDDFTVAPNRYDGSSEYPAPFNFGSSHPGKFVRYPAPTSLVRAAAAFDRINSPTHVWTSGVDFRVVRLSSTQSVLEFSSDPLRLANTVTRSTPEGEELDIWLHRADYDRGDLYSLFGYVVDIYGASTPSVKGAINAVYDSLVQGASVDGLKRMLAAACGLPLVNSDGEVVREIVDHPLRRQVITSRYVYDFVADASISVQIGDVLHRGQSMSSALSVLSTTTGYASVSSLPGLVLDQSFLAVPIRSGLLFKNEIDDVDTSVDGGIARCRFPVYGDPADVGIFWAAVTAAENAGSFSIANLLRTVPGSGQPDPSQVATLVNPMMFVVDSFLAGAMVVAQVDLSSGISGAGVAALSSVRRLMPPHAPLVLMTSIKAPSTPYNQVSGSAGNAVTFTAAPTPNVTGPTLGTRPPRTLTFGAD